MMGRRLQARRTLFCFSPAVLLAGRASHRLCLQTSRRATDSPLSTRNWPSSSAKSSTQRAQRRIRRAVRLPLLPPAPSPLSLSIGDRVLALYSAGAVSHAAHATLGAFLLSPPCHMQVPGERTGHRVAGRRTVASTLRGVLATQPTEMKQETPQLPRWVGRGGSVHGACCAVCCCGTTAQLVGGGRRRRRRRWLPHHLHLAVADLCAQRCQPV